MVSIYFFDGLETLPPLALAAVVFLASPFLALSPFLAGAFLPASEASFLVSKACCFSTFFTIFCSSMRNARMMLHEIIRYEQARHAIMLQIKYDIKMNTYGMNAYGVDTLSSVGMYACI